MNPPVVVDTNILFGALVGRRSRLREILLTESGVSFCCPRFVFIQLFKHKERILAAADLPEEELFEALNSVPRCFQWNTGASPSDLTRVL